MQTSFPLTGSVQAEYSRCGKPGCKCNKGERHGPYYVRVWREGGRKRREYVRLEDVEETRQRCDAWRRERAERRQARAAGWRLIRVFRKQARELERLVKRWQTQQRREGK